MVAHSNQFQGRFTLDYLIKICTEPDQSDLPSSYIAREKHFAVTTNASNKWRDNLPHLNMMMIIASFKMCKDSLIPKEVPDSVDVFAL